MQLNWRNIIISGVIFVLLVASLAVGIYLVRRPQSQSVTSKAALTCDARWPADPATACGRSTQQPAQDASITNLSPNFHWGYGGYRPADNNQCVDPSACSAYKVAVLLYDFHPTSNTDKPFARGDAGPSSSPIKDMSFSSIKKCDYGHVFPNDPDTCHTDGQPTIGTLQANKDYWWTVTPYYLSSGSDWVVHAEQTWNYHFRTSTVSVPVCNSMTLTPNDSVITLSSLARQVTASATGGSGALTYAFNVSNTGGAGNGNISQATAGSATATWTAPTLTGVSTNQSWTITATAKDSQNQTSTVGGCTVTLTYSPQIAAAACQQVTPSKSLDQIKMGDTVTFTGYGSLGTDVGDSIDQVEFTLIKDNAVVSTDPVNTVRAPEKDAGNLKFWKATKDYTISQPGSYNVKIRIHWKNQNTWVS